MKRFADLYTELDRTTRTNEKLAALVQYFQATPKEDAAWALYFLVGNTVSRPVPTKILREWVAEASQTPLWLLEESYHLVGDLAETFALLLPARENGTPLPLHELVETRLVPLPELSEIEKKEALFEVWGSLNRSQTLLFMKLVTGSLRIGVQRTLIAKALSEVTNLPQARIAHRLMGGVSPAPSYLERLVDPNESELDPGHPYPFCLAAPLDLDLEELGNCQLWQAEWKWDGIRAQSIRRAGQLLLWSRGEEVITDTFPEISRSLLPLPSGTVLDGEILAWRDEKPLPFGELQRRLGRKTVSNKMLTEVPVHYLVYDVLEYNAADIRSRSTEERRAILEAVVNELASPVVSLSPLLAFDTWAEFRQLRDEARRVHAEGCMLKAKAGEYGIGRKKGLWWKWKVEPHTCDAVLFYAQRGHGRRAGLFTDYTFAVWKDQELVPVAKAYSGLTDAEFLEVNRFIRENTLERFGPVVSVQPLLVFELAFDDIRVSTRHKAGLALRFPRMLRIRRDKLAKDADSIETLHSIRESL